MFVVIHTAWCNPNYEVATEPSKSPRGQRGLMSNNLDIYGGVLLHKIMSENNITSSEETITSVYPVVYTTIVDLVSTDTESVVEVIDISSDDEENTPTKNEAMQPYPSDENEDSLNQVPLKNTSTPAEADGKFAHEQEFENIVDTNAAGSSTKFETNDFNSSNTKVLVIQEISSSSDETPSSQASNSFSNHGG